MIRSRNNNNHFEEYFEESEGIINTPSYEQAAYSKTHNFSTQPYVFPAAYRPSNKKFPSSWSEWTLTACFRSIMMLSISSIATTNQ